MAQAAEYRSWGKIRNMLDNFDSLPELLADRPPDYSPPTFWDEFEKETHATRHGSGGQVTEALQASAFLPIFDPFILFVCVCVYAIDHAFCFFSVRYSVFVCRDDVVFAQPIFFVK